MNVAHICTYPLKSATGVFLQYSRLTAKGLEYDRHWALIGPDHAVITAREFPKLLALEPGFTADGLTIRHNGNIVLDIPYSPENKEAIDVTVFSMAATAVFVSEAMDAWFSDYLQTPCRLIYMDAHCHRDVVAESGGKQGDVVAYADECPLLLVTEASVTDLNSRLEQPVSFRNFRPNLVVRDCEAFAEDAWRKIQIGKCEFDVSQRCQRCVFTTIDPDTQVKHGRQEPLRTLATYRRHPSGGVAFGVHLIPRSLGTITLNDTVRVLS